MQSSSQQPRHTAPDPDPDVQEEQDGCGDVAATSTAAVATKPKQKRKKRGFLGRHKNGKQKQSKTHDLPPPPPPPVPAPRASNNDTSDPRVWNLMRSINRRENKITTTKTQLDECVVENIQLQKKLKTAKAETKAVQKEAEKEIDVVMKDKEQELKVVKESADQMMERANKKLEVAAKASGNAKVKAAAAAKDSIEAKEKTKVATRAIANATKVAKKLEKKDDVIDGLKQQLKEAERRARDAEEEALKQKALREEMEIALRDMEAKIEEMKAMLEKEAAAGRIVIKKETPEGKGFKKWSQKMVQLIMEYLVAGGSPSAFGKILVSLITLMHPNSTIEELPSIWFVRRCRTVLLIVCQLMSAYRLAKAEKWGQLNCDETKRHQSEYLNLVLSCVEESCEGMPSEYKPILMSACILPEDGRSESQRDAITSFINEMNTWLDEWATLVETRFPDFEHDINRGGLNLSKLADGGLVTQDTCNSASKGSDLIIEQIHLAAEAAGMGKDDVLTIKTYCHHHLRNIWWKWLEDCLSKFLRDALDGSLKEIDPLMRVSTKISDIIRAVDKEFSLPANYPKGQGKEFLHWLKKYHPGALLVPTLRSAGSRHDLIVEGAGAIYFNRNLYIEFLDEQLKTPNANNILQENLFIILSSTEMIALCRLCSIFHFAFSVPLRWLAGNTQDLAEYDWSVLSMSRALNTFEKAMETVMNDGNFILNEDWVMNVFKDIAEDLPPFKKYLSYTFDLKKSSTVDRQTKVLSGERLRAELFKPQREENIETNELVVKMASVAAERVLKELRDPKKHTWEHLDSQNGRLSMKNITPAMHKAGLGKLAANDVSERPFGAMTQQMDSFTTLSGTNATAVAQARINGDFYRVETERSKKKKEDTEASPPPKNGTFIELATELLETAIEFAVSKTKQVRKKEQEALTKQQEQRMEKQEKMKAAGYEKATQHLIDCLYHHDMYWSKRRCKDAAQVDEMLGKLKSKTAKLNEIKEQIRMRVLGLGWGDLHHAWSKDGTHYSVDHLASYLKDTIILEESRRDIPSKPPVKTLERKVLPVLGSLSADVAKLDVVSAEKEQEMRETAEKMRDEQELVGFGDRYGEMQPLHPPVVDEGLLDRRIEICESRGDQLHWHSGTVVGLFGGARKNSVEIHYDAAVLDEGEEPVQAVKLLKHYWNQTKHTTTGKGWRWAKEEVELARGEN